MTGVRRIRGSPRTRPPFWLWLAGGAFFLYFALLVIADARRPAPTGLLVTFDAQGARAASVVPGSPADQAGVRSGDRITEYAGRLVATRLDWFAVDANLPPGQPVRYTLDRDGRAFEVAVSPPEPYLRLPPRRDSVALGIALLGQFATLLLAALIGFRRPQERLARLAAWLLASFSVFTFVLPFGFAHYWRLLPRPVSALLWLPFVSGAAGGVLFFAFCSEFPRRAFRSTATVLAWCVPAIVALAWHLHFGITTIYREARVPIGRDGSGLLIAVNVAYFAAGLGWLAWQYRRLVEPGDRRRMRVLLAGAATAISAALLVAAAFWLRPTPALTSSLFASPLTLVGVPLLLAAPASIAYTILRQRVFDVSLIVRQGVRYALARRLLLSLGPLLVVGLALDITRHGHQPLFDLLRARGWPYALITVVLVAVLVYRDRWLDALDQHFFRSRYHAERILRDLAADLRRGRDPHEAMTAVVEHVHRALHPQFVAALERIDDGPYVLRAGLPAEHGPPALDPGGRLVSMARLLGRPLDLSPDHDSWIAEHLPEAEAALVFESHLELLVPVVVDDAWHVLLVLGPRRSEEPYSAGDMALLEAIGSSLALVAGHRPPTVATATTLAECPACGACFDTSLARCPTDRALLVATDLPLLLANRYRLDSRLGAGGMGTVYLARDTALDRAVAVKVLAEHLVGSRDAARRFRQEAQTTATFAHPNVVTIHDFGTTDANRAFLVMERLDGRTLRAQLETAGTLPWPRALQIVTEVCDVLGAAHARGLVHRDLKPENVFLARVGTAETTKLLDFGIAKALSDGERRDPWASTERGLLLGSLPYMSPEQLQGGVVQASWDLWALAVTTHEMLRGRRPAGSPIAGRTGGKAHGTAPSGDPAGAHVSAGGNAEAEAPALRTGETGSALDRFFALALHEDPAVRPQTAIAFRDALASALAPVDTDEPAQDGRPPG